MFWPRSGPCTSSLAGRHELVSPSINVPEATLVTEPAARPPLYRGAKAQVPSAEAIADREWEGYCEGAAVQRDTISAPVVSRAACGWS